MLTVVTVLHLSRALAGTLCTMMLGDMGASVFEVKRPDGGGEPRVEDRELRTNAGRLAVR